MAGMDAFDRRRLYRTIIKICVLSAWVALGFAAIYPLTRPGVPGWVAGLAYAAWVVVAWAIVIKLPDWLTPPFGNSPESPEDE
jgi:hypothetical protein